MLDHIQRGWEHSTSGESVNAQTNEPERPSFDDQVKVNGAKAELMAGNHRVEALKDLLRRSKSEGDERLWICDIRQRYLSTLATSVRDGRIEIRSGFINPLIHA